MEKAGPYLKERPLIAAFMTVEYMTEFVYNHMTSEVTLRSYCIGGLR